MDVLYLQKEQTLSADRTCRPQTFRGSQLSSIACDALDNTLKRCFRRVVPERFTTSRTRETSTSYYYSKSDAFNDGELERDTAAKRQQVDLADVF